MGEETCRRSDVICRHEARGQGRSSARCLEIKSNRNHDAELGAKGERAAPEPSSPATSQQARSEESCPPARPFARVNQRNRAIKSRSQLNRSIEVSRAESTRVAVSICRDHGGRSSPAFALALALQSRTWSSPMGLSFAGNTARTRARNTARESLRRPTRPSRHDRPQLRPFDPRSNPKSRGWKS